MMYEVSLFSWMVTFIYKIILHIYWWYERENIFFENVDVRICIIGPIVVYSISCQEWWSKDQRAPDNSASFNVLHSNLVKFWS